MRSLATKTLSLALSVALLATAACGAQQATESSNESTSAAATEATNAEATGDDASLADYEAAIEGKGVISSFIGKEFYDGTIKDSDDALKAIESVMSEIGGDETTVLESVADRETETGTTYYTFQQQAGDITVQGASVKLIADKDGKAVGLVSSIMPNVQLPSLDSWGATQEQAEDAVRGYLVSNSVTGVDVIANSTERTLIALENNSNVRRYVWVAYTRNYDEDSHIPYLAHYVSEDGEYLYNIPVSEPGNVEAIIGESASFDFGKYTQDEWTGMVTLHDGSEKELTVPVLKDDEGTSILGDAKRRVLCADYSRFVTDEMVIPIESAEGEFESVDTLVYYTYLRIWDFFDGIGWSGPDGLSSPSLLLMNYLDENGDPIENAAYYGRNYGWQTFTFSRAVSFGECTDVMTHEFTHCVTGTLMTASLYINDVGAINEGMSDIMGNLVEMLIDDNPDGAWIYGEAGGEETLSRSLKDPHIFNQPEFAYDAFYETAVDVGNQKNDQGGVHTNSSMLNIISYRLDQAGMAPADQQYFWMNVAMALTPNTDYPLIAELLPWCMRQSGYDQYVEPLEKAIAEAKLTLTEAPEGIPEGCGLVTLECPDQELSDAGNFVLYLYRDGVNTDARFWPVVGTTLVRAIVVPGDYKVTVWSQRDEEGITMAYEDGAWVESGEPIDSIGTPSNGSKIHVEAGDTIELPQEGVLG